MKRDAQWHATLTRKNRMVQGRVNKVGRPDAAGARPQRRGSVFKAGRIRVHSVTGQRVGKRAVNDGRAAASGTTVTKRGCNRPPLYLTPNDHPSSTQHRATAILSPLLVACDSWDTIKMTVDTPLVTTIIPTYRRPHLLRRAVKSALAQQGVSLQVCVYDNASGDETRDVVAALAAEDSRVKYTCHPTNIGGFANFQYGLQHVQTPFFSFLSDDDVLLPGFYAAAMAGFQEYPDAMLWAGVTVRMDPAGRVYDARVERWPREGLYAGAQGVAQMTGGLAPTWTGAVIRRDVLETVGLLDEAVGAPSDLDWILRIAARHPFIICKRPVALFVIHPESFSETGPFSAIWPGWKKMIENLTVGGALSPEERGCIAARLNADARRMLFRRSLGALSKSDYSYVREAANVLSAYYRQRWSSASLKIMRTVCSRLPLAQRCYTFGYSTAVNVALDGRADLQRRHGEFARYLTDQIS